MNTPAQPAYRTGIVKSIQTGDSIVIRKTTGSPPPEKVICLSGILAPKLARQKSPNNDTETKDEPYAWEAREFLRSRLIGQEVAFTCEKPANSSNREYGTVWTGKDPAKDENIAEALVAEGLARVRDNSRNVPQMKRLVELEETAKSLGKGIWGDSAEQLEHVRDVKYSIENPKAFVNKYNGKPIKAIIEYVRDGSTYRVLLLPEFYQITLVVAGIRCPAVKNDGDSEPYAIEARCMVEYSLLQQDVEVVLLAVNNNNFVGTVLHPKGNFAEYLLSKGYAKCVDWSLAYMKSGDAQSLRAAEKIAKDRRERIWKDYVASGPVLSGKDKEFTATVVEVLNGDALNVKLSNGTVKKIFLSNIRPPREKSDEEGKAPTRTKNFKPLYDIPWMLEAREFLRKRLIGRKVGVSVDYVQPAKDNYAEKTCCTVTVGGTNIAEALVSEGLATVVKFGADQRSIHFDKLTEAAAKAEKAGLGMYNKKNTPSHRIQDNVIGTAQRNYLLTFLKRAQKAEGVVEFVVSGSRMRVYIPKEAVVITFMLAGIRCPRNARAATAGQAAIAGEPYADEACAFTREKCLQRNVTFSIEDMDKAGNFYGWLWIENENLSVSLVEHGLASVHFTAESSEHARALKNAEESAKAKRLNIWKDFVEVEEVEKPSEVQEERKVKYEKVVVTLVLPDGHFYAQSVDNGPKLEALMENINREVLANPPLPGAYSFKRGDLCLARFHFDNNWYRAKIEKVHDDNVSVLYIDYGNRETLNVSRCAPLPAGLAPDAPYAHEYALACVKFPADEDDKLLAVRSLGEDILNKTLHLNVESKGAPPAVTLVDPVTGEDIGKGLLADGLLLVESTRERRLAKLLAEYRAAQESAKKQRLNLWQHGDISEDDAREFGLQH